MNQSSKQTESNPSEISLKDAVLKIQSLIKYINSKWLKILIIGFLGGLIGLAYSILIKPKYTAICTFVLDDGSRSGGLSQYAGLASIAGIDLGSSSGSGGIFQGDNILELYKSRLMIEKALLSESNFNGKNEFLIDRYIEFNKLQDEWQENDHIGKVIFTGNPENFNRKQDSIITSLVELFNTNVLTVTKPDKKLSIIQVEVVSKDEFFAKNFANKLVETVNDFYVQTKTKKASETVRLLQKQADSIKTVLNLSISGVALAMDASPNANPSLVSLRVPSQKKQIDVQSSSAIYSEIVKNLELSKMALRQETPLIQVIDKPILPLKVIRVRKIKGVLIGAILGIFISITMIVTKRSFDYLVM